jgi:hypothetical protein
VVKVVTSARAGGVITVGEAGTIAVVVDTFVRAIEASDFERRLEEAEDGVSRNSDTAAPRSRIGRVELSTGEQDFAADSLQVQQT